MLENKKDLAFAKGVGERISLRRKQLRLTQEQIAEKSGLSHQFFSSVEAGKKNIRAENAVKIPQALRVSTDYILTGKSYIADIEYITSMLKELDEVQLRCAEEIIKSLVTACKQSK